MTQEALAASAGLSVQMVRALERAAAPGNPRLTTLFALADALGVDVAVLLRPGTPE